MDEAPNPVEASTAGDDHGVTTRGRGVTALIAALFVAMLVSTFPEFALGVLAPVLVEELGLGEAAIGLAAAVMYLAAAVIARAAGRHLDDVGSRAALTIVYGAAAGALVLLAASRSLAWLIVAGLVAGVALGINNPITSRYIVAGVPAGRRGLALGIKQTGVKVGQTAAGATIPWLALNVGWRPGLLVVAACSVVLLIVSLPVLPGRDPAKQRPVGSAADARIQVRWLQYFAATMAVGQSAITTYLALYAVQRLDMSFTRAGMVVATFAVTGTVARLVWAAAAERIGHSTGPLLVISGGAVVGLVLLLSAVTLGPTVLWIAAVVTGITVGSWNVVVQFAVLLEVEPARTASATGAVQAAFMFGMAVGAPLFGAVVQVTDSFEAAWAISVVLAASAFVTALLRRLRPREPRAQLP